MWFELHLWLLLHEMGYGLPDKSQIADESLLSNTLTYVNDEECTASFGSNCAC